VRGRSICWFGVSGRHIEVIEVVERCVWRTYFRRDIMGRWRMRAQRVRVEMKMKVKVIVEMKLRVRLR
jgi:hypothetical protein